MVASHPAGAGAAVDASGVAAEASPGAWDRREAVSVAASVVGDVGVSVSTGVGGAADD